MIIFQSVKSSLALCIAIATTLLIVAQEVWSEEVGVDSQSLTVQSAPNATNETLAGNLTSTIAALDESSNKFPLPVFPPPPRFPVPPRTQSPQLYHRPHHGPFHYPSPNYPPHRSYHYAPHSPQLYRPLIPVDPVHIDHLANTGKLIVGELVNSFGQAFQSLLSHRMRPIGGQARFLNGDNIAATAAASQLLPTKLLANSPAARVDATGQPTSERNETLDGPSNDLPHNENDASINYDVEGQKLREDIVSKLGHLQTVLSTALEVSQERHDIIRRRILQQTNNRLEQFKERADRILSDPRNTKMVLQTLNTLNHGVNGLLYFLSQLFKLPEPSHKTGAKTTAVKEDLENTETKREEKDKQQ